MIYIYIYMCLSLASFGVLGREQSSSQGGLGGPRLGPSYVIDTSRRRFLRSLTTGTCLSLASFGVLGREQSSSLFRRSPRLRESQALRRWSLSKRHVVLFGNLLSLYLLVQLHGCIHQLVEDDEGKVLNLDLQAILFVE